MDMLGVELAQVVASEVHSLRQRARLGDAEAQSSLALLYALGRGVRQDEAEAARLWGLAAGGGAGRGQWSAGCAA